MVCFGKGKFPRDILWKDTVVLTEWDMIVYCLSAIAETCLSRWLGVTGCLYHLVAPFHLWMNTKLFIP